MFESFVEFTRECIESNGITGIFIIALFESFIFPVPTALIITTGTALNLDVYSVVVMATIGSVLGAVVGYYVGARGGRPVLVWLFNEKKVERVDRYFDKYGVYAVGVAALTPLPFKIFTISAGVARMKLIPFILICIPTRFIQFLLFALFGDVLSQFIFL
ncbi:MAG: hypothetical protein B6U97_02660 [Candidatus Altiarchaeales archaeon ex4484_96]|nr:MAG: hypothetical protein B6U97_02660 [Candidatus Altiarchaeales archaeon ex4484_96]